MEIEMFNQDWLPAAWKHKSDEENPLGTLRKQIDSMFEEFGGGFIDQNAGFKVRSNLSETDSEIRVTAELPGLTDTDVDVSVSGDQITIKGEKKSEKEENKDEKGREFHRMERVSGSFYRSMRLPFEIDADQVQADVKDGVLTVTIQKPAVVVAKTKKIEVKHSG
jgi:HSP20 family protein